MKHNNDIFIPDKESAKKVLQVFKREVVGKRPRREFGQPTIDGIRPRLKRGESGLEITRRG